MPPKPRFIKERGTDGEETQFKKAKANRAFIKMTDLALEERFFLTRTFAEHGFDASATAKTLRKGGLRVAARQIEINEQWLKKNMPDFQAAFQASVIQETIAQTHKTSRLAFQIVTKGMEHFIKDKSRLEEMQAKDIKDISLVLISAQQQLVKLIAAGRTLGTAEPSRPTSPEELESKFAQAIQAIREFLDAGGQSSNLPALQEATDITPVPSNDTPVHGREQKRKDGVGREGSSLDAHKSTSLSDAAGSVPGDADYDGQQDDDTGGFEEAVRHLQ